MPIPPPPPGFQLDTAQSGLGRPVIRRNPQPSPQTPAQARSDVIANRNAELEGQIKQLQIAEAQRKAAEQARRQQEAAAAQTDTVNELLNVIDATARAGKLSRTGLFATGFGSDVANLIPGTPRRDIQGIIDTIGSNTAFDRLQKMRNDSPTGGALGAISERELALLQGSIASMDPGQSDAQFQANMKRIQDAYARVLKKLPGGGRALADWRRNWIRENSPKGRHAPNGGGWSIEVAD
jgi:hypothetical protein